MSFQFKFDANPPHQLAAINSTVELLSGLAKAESTFNLKGEIAPNAVENADLADYWLEENLQAVQARHNEAHPDAPIPLLRLERDDGSMLEDVSNDSHSCPHFTFEMETGTGKTYVYFRTMLELYQKYGFLKFLIVVPSVAILEGVKKTFKVTQSHLVALYGKTNFNLLEYDGSKMGQVGSFAKHAFPVAMVMTQQSFIRASNNFYKQTDQLTGERKPFQWIQETRPIVILDEPQNMGSDKSRAAIRTLKPLFVLRYSATHRKDQQPNIVYRLTPIQAFRLGLVKQIEVVGVSELGLQNVNSLRLEDVLRSPIRAVVRMLAIKDGITAERQITLKQGDSLKKHTGLPEHEGMEVANIHVGTADDAGKVEFKGGPQGGLVISTADEVVGGRQEVWRAQIESTLHAHFERQEALRPQGIKVLSLFFIDRVNNYVGEPGILRQLFDECFDRLKKGYPSWENFEATEVRSGYFAKRKKKDKVSKQEVDIYSDDITSDSDEAKETFKLIMQKKEILLSFPDGRDPDKKVAFIFAHSALKEGWDNPNVFQICTLNQTTSSVKKRQEIGRGLRLCVNQAGDRPEGSGINILTVVANESYESYVKNLQLDYVNDGETPPPPPKRPKDGTAKRRAHLYGSQEFKAFWRRLCQKLKYRLEIDTETLIADAIAHLNRSTFPEPAITISQGRFVMSEYYLRVDRALANGKVLLKLEQRNTQADPVQQFNFVKADEILLEVKKGDDLAKLTDNPHLRGFRVVKIWEQYGESRVLFTNGEVISQSESHHFENTRVDNARLQESRAAVLSYSLPDFISRVSQETSITRATLLRILEGMALAQREKLFRHPEGWANQFMGVLKEVVADHIADRIRYEASVETFDDPSSPDELFQQTVKQPQKELIEGGPKSLYDFVQIDSDVERQFVDNRLRPDEDAIVVYFKFPPSFRIDLPRIIGDYNPDWGVVRLLGNGQMALELVRETKGNDDLSKLRFTNEGRKIRIAQRYFDALGIDYRALSPKVEQYWQSARVAARQEGRQLRLVKSEEAPEGLIAVPVVSLRAAAGAFSQGQAPDVQGYVHLSEHDARLPGLFVAQLSGDSMDRVAPPDAWCLWQHFGAAGASAPANGDRLIARREGSHDPEYGEFTFKRWAKGRTRERLEPMSTNPTHAAIELNPEEKVHFIARFVKVVELGE